MESAYSLHIQGSLQVLPQSKDMQVRLIVDPKLPVGVNGCLSLCVSPAIVWRPVQVVPAQWAKMVGYCSRWRGSSAL